STSGGVLVKLSRRLAQKECRLNYISALMPGDVIPAKITHLESFGAFVDIGVGITSLLSIDSMSVSRISHPSQRVAVGDFIYSVVKSIDEQGRIYMSERELLGTWLQNAEKFTEGECVRGIIRSVESYGVFVELTPNLAGLAEYRDDVAPGQTVAAYIKSIIPGKMKIKLIIIDVSEGSDKMPLEYFLNPSECAHIESWKYSPPGCEKVIESVF
ncbi:MAG: 30S ribosomal protein S1, partial [Clostridia bacterium]|nr:30S ribosomal protein S1 [Clostridia bacterium]